MMRLAISLVGLASAAGAEGRNDPFMKCEFAGGREVILAEAGEAVEWREAAQSAPAQVKSDSGEGEERTVVIVPQLGELTFLYLTSFTEDGGANAALTTAALKSAGTFEAKTDLGACKEFFG